MPCPHYDIKIVQRSKRQSAVAAAAYQSGDRLFSEYDQRQKSYSEKQGIVHTEILLPENAPPGYADRNTLWNAVEAVENQWNSQLARRFIMALPRELSREEQIRLMREYCQAQFVSKGMIADFAIHDKGDGNPHAHILLTLRPMDEQGHWSTPLTGTTRSTARYGGMNGRSYRTAILKRLAGRSVSICAPLNGRTIPTLRRSTSARQPPLWSAGAYRPTSAI